MDQLTITTGAGVVKLEGAKNWNVWKFQVSVLMRGLGIFEIAEHESETRRDSRTGGMAERRCESSECNRNEIVRIRNVTCLDMLKCSGNVEKVAQHIWTKGDTSVYMVQQQFFQLKYSPDTEMSLFISKVQEFQNKLNQLGEGISDKLIITKILMSLPEKVQSFHIGIWGVNVRRKTNSK